MKDNSGENKSKKKKVEKDKKLKKSSGRKQNNERKKIWYSFEKYEKEIEKYVNSNREEEKREYV